MNQSAVAEAIGAYPEVAAIVVLIVGVLLARAAQWGVARAGRHVTRRYSTTLTPTFSRGASLLVFWAIVIAAMFVAMRLLGVAELSDWLRSALNFVPRLFVGVAIIGIGHLVGIIAGNVVRRTQTEPSRSAMLPKFAYAAVLLVAIITGARHMGIDVSFIAQLSLTLLTILLGALALAFALGAREHVANLIARSELNDYSAGMRIRVDDVEGDVVEIKRTGILIATEEGQVAIPASRFATSHVLRLTDRADQD